MAGIKLLKTSGLAALAAGLVLAAMPTTASAQERGDRWNRGEASGNIGGDNGRNRDGGNGEGRQQRQQSQQEQVQVQAPAQAPQPQAAPQRNWNGGGQRGDNSGWTARAQQQAPAPTPQAQAAPRRNWNDGNGTSRRSWGQSGGNQGGWAAQSQSAPTPQAQPAPQQQRRWNGGDRGTSGSWSQRGTPNDSGWSGRDTRQQQAKPPIWGAGRETYRSSDRDHNNDRYRNSGGRNDDRYRNNGGRNDSWNNRQGYNHQGNNHQGYNRQGYSGSYTNWNRDWRRDNRYDWNGWRSNNRNVFRLGRYHSPYSDWSYRRLSIGFYLDSLFFSNNYWINDPWQYRLPDAYGPYRWVRYYDDALLVDIYSGEVVDVIHDVFW